MNDTPRRPWLARVRWPVFTAGVSAAVMSLFWIWSDAVATGPTLTHATAPVLVYIAIVTGHYGIRRLPSLGAVLCVLISIVTSALIVYEGVARRAEQRDTKIATADAQQLDRLDLRAELMTQRKLVTPAKRAEAVACRKGREKTADCFKKTANVSGLEKAVADLERQLAETVVMPGDAKYRNIGQQAAVFGFDAAWIKEATQTLDPLLIPTLLEICSIVLISIGLGEHERSMWARARDWLRRKPRQHTSADTAQTSFAYDPDAVAFFRPYGPEGDGGAPVKPQRPVVPLRPVDPVSPSQKSEVLANLLTQLALGRTIPSQKALREEYGIPRSTMCDWWKEWKRDGLIPTPKKVGKCLVLTSA